MIRKTMTFCLLGAWLSEGYNNKPHSSLNGNTPAEVFMSDTAPLRFHSMGIDQLTLEITVKFTVIFSASLVGGYYFKFVVIDFIKLI
jgi:hypothetical protein